MDSLEHRYNRLKNAVQQAILQNFPNPERKGCPGDEVVREIAARDSRLQQGRQIALPRSMVRVRVILPRFSRPGVYQIAVCRDRTIESAIAENTSNTIAEGQREIVTVQLDLQSAKPGSFWFATKRESDEAGYDFPVRIS